MFLQIGSNDTMPILVYLMISRHNKQLVVIGNKPLPGRVMIHVYWRVSATRPPSILHFLKNDWAKEESTQQNDRA